VHQIIHIHADAPLKPAPGERCNGCGVCCLAEPCPLGVLLTGRRRGACRALHWDDAGARYRCGAFGARGDAAGPGVAWRHAVVARWIGAGRGCDSDAEIESG
jgi:Fe-S-cluster-containing hydrogenase component 2